MDKVFEAIIKAVVDHSGITIPGLSGVLIALLGYVASSLYKRYQNVNAAKDLAPYFNEKNIQEKRALFIESQYQNNSPAREAEPGFSHQFVSKSKLIPHFINTAFNGKKVSDKFYLVLADSGMGKTTFMINLFVRYNSFFNLRRKYKMKLIPFGYKGNIIDKIKEVKKEDIPNTILLLDAFDEYTKILPPAEPDGLTDDERFRKVLDEVIETVQDFREVVITSRTQYFPGEESQPYELKIPNFNNDKFHVLAKFYLSPFDDNEIRRYLNKKYGIFRFWNYPKKRIARQIVENSPNLMARPMLLSYVDNLVGSDQTYTNTYQIYETLVNKWIEREGEKREHKQTDCEKLKHNLHKYSQLVAVKIYEKRKETNSLQLSKADATDVNVELKDYQMTGQSLLTRDAENNWKFAHKSILEFFLAKEAAENLDFAMMLDFAGMDQAKKFCSEIMGATSLVSSNFVAIKGGEFLMGSPGNETRRNNNEMQHPVRLSDFYMCKYTVTFADFKKFYEESRYLTDAEKSGSSRVFDGYDWKDKEGINWRFGVSGKERNERESDHPVIHVSWNDAVSFANWLSSKTGKTFRLPTEAEWEDACRAGTTSPFSTGDNLTTDQANYNGNFLYKKNKKGIFRNNTVAAGSFAPNPWGLYNMHGNVLEWCGDWYDQKYYEECKAIGVVENPAGPERGSRRVIRGGSWNDRAVRCQSAIRSNRAPDLSFYFIGFRLIFVP